MDRSGEARTRTGRCNNIGRDPEAKAQHWLYCCFLHIGCNWAGTLSLLNRLERFNDLTAFTLYSLPWWPSVCIFQRFHFGAGPPVFSMSEASCPVSGSVGGQCPAGHVSAPRRSMGPRGCSFSGFTQQGDMHQAFDVSRLFASGIEK